MAVKSIYDGLMTSPDKTAARTRQPRARRSQGDGAQAGTAQADIAQAGRQPGTGQPSPSRASRQREAGEVTRRETRRRLLAAARAEVAERGYAAATVSRIASRAGVSVQSLYNDWGSKRNLLQAVMETAVTGDDDTPVTGRPPAIIIATLSPEDAADPRRLLAHLARQYRLLAERSAVGWQTYRDAAAVDPDVAADWQHLSEMRRSAFHALLARIPAVALRPGLSPAAAADTAWAIASPDIHHQLVRQAGYSYDQLEEWVRATLSAALFPDE